jgi:hypothetical protein
VIDGRGASDPEALGSALLKRLRTYNDERAEAGAELRRAIEAVLERYEHDKPLSAATVLLRLDPEAYWAKGWPTRRTVQRHLKKIRAPRLRHVAADGDTLAGMSIEQSRVA